ncbi:MULTISPECIES: hypothetical protein [Sphingomonas]|uniref:Uncharacterized protein n=1 Tax=Sphingomonas lycopersici TaxID=2951807 RepID=A0AA41ZJQ7_9SPHN|nr:MULTISPECIES: hypothetical protein [Sphingomonas]MCW6532918.1 hypothetical protein [Sphingomonas lycopersici]MCW6537043.1 hypothetical protein [Sphingomonas lycopersici]
MDGEATRRGGDREFHERRARQAYGMAYRATSLTIRRLHLKMAIEHERRADVADG